MTLFSIFISNVDERLKCTCAKLADDSRLENKVECEKEKLPYRNIDMLEGWPSKVFAEINVKLCTWYGIISSSNAV